MTGHVWKRVNTWAYVFDIGKVNGKRKKVTKGGFKTKNVYDKLKLTTCNH